MELLNVLRPTVAVAVYCTYAAHALHEDPAWRKRLAAGDAADAENFAHEVRRFYPFFPVVAAETRCAFTWRGYDFPEGVRVLLDLYGTDHDPRLWTDPDAFNPDRFAGDMAEPVAACPFGFIPQGGAAAATHYRCPGEGIPDALIKAFAKFLTRLDYTVPEQDLSIDF